jgi:hypothetical protein
MSLLESYAESLRRQDVSNENECGIDIEKDMIRDTANIVK